MVGRKLVSLLGAGAVVATIMSAPASGAVTVPEVVQITDPWQDANFLNDHGAAGTGANVNGQFVGVPDEDDHATPDDFNITADMGKVWFSATEDTVSAHVQTEAPAPSEEAVFYRVYTNPGEGEMGSSTLGCLRFLAVVPGSAPGGGNYQGPQWVKIHDTCNVGTNRFNHSADAQLTIEELEDGTGVVTITADRSYSPLLQGEEVAIVKPYAETAFTAGGVAGGAQLLLDQLKYDTTKIGTDVELAVDGGGGGGGGGGPVVKCLGLEDIKGNHVAGTPDADVLKGTPKRDVICGLGGEDVLKGLGGNDLLIAGDGFDKIYAGDGKDQLLGDAGNDGLNGGPGNDKISGGVDNDRLYGNLGKDTCKGGAGYDFRKSCE